MKRHFKSAVQRTSALAAMGLLASGWLLPNPPARAADKYDKDLEHRVETLERELNIMEGDSKGKNAAASVDVPTFARASKNVQELVLSGEIRFRNEYSETDSQTVSKTAQADRNRFRFRLFADYKLTDNFFAGAAIQTTQAADSGNTTITEGFDNYSLYLWRFFVGWQNDFLKIVGGKQANPFYSDTEMLWDADISPIGITETFKLPISPTFDLQVIAGQFTFYDNAENAPNNNPRTIANAAGAQVANPAFVNNGKNNLDTYLLYQQVVATFKPTNTLTLTGAGGFLFYAGHGGTGGVSGTPTFSAGEQNAVGAQVGTIGSGLGGTLQNSAAFASANGTRDLYIATFSGDVKYDLSKTLKVKAYADAAYNFRGGSRDFIEYGVANDDEVNKIAFSTGVTIGADYTIKKKGDFLILAEYRQVGLGAIDPNLNDSDWNFSRLGFRGIKAAASYGFQPWLIGTVTYFGANNLGADKNLNIGVGNYNATQILQVDLTAKF